VMRKMGVGSLAQLVGTAAKLEAALLSRSIATSACGRETQSTQILFTREGLRYSSADKTRTREWPAARSL
jgi:hypothetical protein